MFRRSRANETSSRKRFTNIVPRKAKKRAKKRNKRKPAQAPAPQRTLDAHTAPTLTAKPPLFGVAQITPTNKGAKPNKVKNCGQADLRAYTQKFLPEKNTNSKKGKTRYPTAVELRLNGFGKQDKDHSAVQEACAETTLFLLLKSGYLDKESTEKLCTTHPLVDHLERTVATLKDYDFGWLRRTDEKWASQIEIEDESKKAMLACLCHYDLDVSLLMRFLGGNYVGAHRDVERTVLTLQQHNIPDELIAHYRRVMTVGCPRIFNTTITRENALKYWRAGNNPSINKHLDQVLTAMNKEHKHKFVAALPSWMWRFIPHLFITPQHNHVAEGKKDRLIYDAAFQHDAESVPINMMTEDAAEVELPCKFGHVKQRLYRRLYNLRITYPNTDLVIHANDVKSCFRQLKHHPDVMGAFSYIIHNTLFLQCALTFGSDFSPASWEVLRRIIEMLAESLYKDSALRAKHREVLDKLTWQKSLGSAKARFVTATPDSKNQGVQDCSGNDVSTPHDMFVDDDLYSEVFKPERLEQAAAASIEAIFILLGHSDLTARQDPISWDKFLEMPVDWHNKALGTMIDTRRMAARTPENYTKKTLSILEKTWHKGENTRHTFLINEAEVLAGRLGYNAETLPWLRFVMSSMYSSLAYALGESKAHLVRTDRNFRKLTRCIKRDLRFHKTKDKDDNAHGKPAGNDVSKRTHGFSLSQTSKRIHHSRKRFEMNRTLRKEIKLVHDALTCNWIDPWRPIGHMIPRDPSGTAWSDSSLHAAGGFSYEMGFWWYIRWPDDIQERTLKFVSSDKDGTLITINALEYASLIINYVAATHVLVHECPSADNPHPMVLLYADNTAAESWMKKASSSSDGARALGYIQAALMMNNPVGIYVDRVTTTDNVVADKISRIASETHLAADIPTLCQEFPQLKSCQRFHPSVELTSLILETLSTKKYVDPLTVSRRVLASPGRITT